MMTLEGSLFLDLVGKGKQAMAQTYPLGFHLQ